MSRNYCVTWYLFILILYAWFASTSLKVHQKNISFPFTWYTCCPQILNERLMYSNISFVELHTVKQEHIFSAFLNLICLFLFKILTNGQPCTYLHNIHYRTWDFVSQKCILYINWIVLLVSFVTKKKSPWV